MGTSKSKSKIEETIEDILDYIDDCKTSPLSNNKIIVQKDRMYELLDDLRRKTPDEVRRYQKIIANRETLLADAEAKAKHTVEEAETLAKHLVEDSEIMQQAYRQASELVNSANEEAQAALSSAKEEATELIRAAKESADSMMASAKEASESMMAEARAKADAMIAEAKGESDSMYSESYAYANDILGMIESILQNSLNESKTRYDALHSTLSSTLNIVKDNLDQINQQSYAPVGVDEQQYTQQYDSSYDQDDDYEDDFED